MGAGGAFDRDEVALVLFSNFAHALVEAATRDRYGAIDRDADPPDSRKVGQNP